MFARELSCQASTMAVLYCRTLFFNQFRHLHTSKTRIGVPTFDIHAERKVFLDVLPEVINSIVTGPKLTGLSNIQSRMKQLLEYTLGRGKLGRGLMVSVGYRMFEEPENFSEETQHKARILGWCTEMLQAKFLMLDDIVDGGTIRRGKPCWHLHQNLGLWAVNDSILLYQSMLDLLDIYFGQTPMYGDLLGYFNESVYKVSIGEHLDLHSGYSKEKNNIDVFNMERILDIATNKTAYYSFKLPIFAALVLVKNGKNKATKELNEICMDFGKLMQCQDDYIDVYSDEIISGKNGRDIQEGKCSWLAVTALKHCNAAQLATFKEYYGSNEPEHVKRIKQLYDELHLPQLYADCEKTMYDNLVRQIQTLPTEGDKKFLLEILNAIYKRLY